VHATVRILVHRWSWHVWSNHSPTNAVAGRIVEY